MKMEMANELGQILTLWWPQLAFPHFKLRFVCVTSLCNISFTGPLKVALSRLCPPPSSGFDHQVVGRGHGAHVYFVRARGEEGGQASRGPHSHDAAAALALLCRAPAVSRKR